METTFFGNVGLGAIRAKPAYVAAFLSPLLALYDARSLELTDGAAVTSWTDSSGNGGPSAIAAVGLGAPPVYKAAAWGDGGPAVRFTSASSSVLKVNQLAHLYGSAGQAFAVAMLIRCTANTGGCLFGFGCNGGVLAEFYLLNNLPRITTTGGASPIDTTAPAWIHPWVPVDGDGVAQDAIVVISVDPAGVTFVWINGHRYQLPATAVDSANSYADLAIGALVMAGGLYNPGDFDLRAVAIRSGAATRRWIASAVEYWKRRDLIHQVVWLVTDSIGVYDLDNTNVAAWPALVAMDPSEVARKAQNSLPGTFNNFSVGGMSIGDLALPSGFPDGGTYVNGETALNTDNPSAITGANGELGYTQTDESGNPLDLDAPLTIVHGCANHEVAHLYPGTGANSLVSRQAAAVAAGRVAAPGSVHVVMAGLQAIQTTWSAPSMAAYNAAGAAGATGADLWIPFDTCPTLAASPTTWAVDQDGDFTHPTAATRTAMAAWFTTHALPQIRAVAQAAWVARNMAAAG